MEELVSHHNRVSHSFTNNPCDLSLLQTTQIFDFMVRLRLVEETIKEEYHPEDLMRCPIHFCVGQEAVPAVLNLLLGPRDHLFSHHRSHGHYLAKGCDLEGMIFELHGKSKGVNRGLAGSQDISSSSNNFFAGAILAGTIGIAVGAAAAIRARGGTARVVCCFGEAATEQGLFWEAMNYACLKALPILFICENNDYATYSHTDKRVFNSRISEKARAFGIDVSEVFGNDALAVFQQVQKGLDHLAYGPFLIDAITYRLSSHVGPEDDSENYRTEEEILYWKGKDPIENLRKKLANDLSVDHEKAVTKKMTVELHRIFEKAKRPESRSTPYWAEMNVEQDESSHCIPTLDLDLALEPSHRDSIPAPY
jgi:TPP-dependent pyruvate/acetoin dehydrogenase alpha subunit